MGRRKKTVLFQYNAPKFFDFSTLPQQNIGRRKFKDLFPNLSFSQYSSTLRVKESKSYEPKYPRKRNRKNERKEYYYPKKNDDIRFDGDEEDERALEELENKLSRHLKKINSLLKKNRDRSQEYQNESLRFQKKCNSLDSTLLNFDKKMMLLEKRKKLKKKKKKKFYSLGDEIVKLPYLLEEDNEEVGKKKRGKENDKRKRKGKARKKKRKNKDFKTSEIDVSSIYFDEEISDDEIDESLYQNYNDRSFVRKKREKVFNDIFFENSEEYRSSGSSKDFEVRFEDDGDSDEEDSYDREGSLEIFGGNSELLSLFFEDQNVQSPMKFSELLSRKKNYF